MMRIIGAVLIIAMTSCGNDKFDQKSFNYMAEEIKAEVNKLSIPCGLHEKVKLENVQEVKIEGVKADEIELEKFKKQILMLDDQAVEIIINKTTKDGFQFKYTTDITEYSLDSKPVITRDEGTIWMYCDNFKDHNSPKKDEPVQPSGVMITVE